MNKFNIREKENDVMIERWLYLFRLPFFPIYSQLTKFGKLQICNIHAYSSVNIGRQLGSSPSNDFAARLVRLAPRQCVFSIHLLNSIYIQVGSKSRGLFYSIL